MTWIIEIWLQKREVTFSDDVLASVDVVFAFKLPNVVAETTTKEVQ